MNDSNFRKTSDSFIWDIPLNLNQKKIGLCSFALDVKNKSKSDENVLVVSCNLIDKTMENQFGILAIIEGHSSLRNLYSKSSLMTGYFIKQIKNFNIYITSRTLGHMPIEI